MVLDYEDTYMAWKEEEIRGELAYYYRMLLDGESKSMLADKEKSKLIADINKI